MGDVAHMREMRNSYKVLVRNPQWKRPLERPRHRWEANIKVDLRETAWNVVEWFMSQDRDQ
jgi:hypothetical protein